MSGYRQEVFNVVLAQLLQERGLVTAPESVISVGAAHARRMPDVIVNFDGLRTAIEGEVDDQPDCEQRAVTSAMKRVEEGIAHIGVAVVYPAELRRLDFHPLKAALAKRVLRINVLTESAEPVGRFVEGTVDYLGSALRQTFNLLVQEDVVSKAAELLELGIEGFSAAMVTREAEVGRVARALDIREITIEARDTAGLPQQEKLQFAMRTAVGRITGLVLANAFIFQEILSNHNTDVHPLGRIMAGRNPKGDFIEHWQFIKDEINYYPILHIAQEALLSLSSSPDISLGIKRLVEIAQEIVRMRAALRHDLMGRIYHCLLEKAQKYLGTCYTSIPAAIMLLKTALRPTAWPLDWSDVTRLSNFRVADRVVRTQRLDGQPSVPSRLDLTGLAPGVYVVRLTSGGRSATQKLVVEQ